MVLLLFFPFLLPFVASELERVSESPMIQRCRLARVIATMNKISWKFVLSLAHELATYHLVFVSPQGSRLRGCRWNELMKQ